MTKANQKIIDDNPGLTPYELLAKGLTDKGFSELVANQDAEKQLPKKIEPVIIPQEIPLRAIPVLSPIIPQNNPGMAYLVGNGKRIAMSRTAAEKFIRKGRNPNFTIE